MTTRHPLCSWLIATVAAALGFVLPARADAQRVPLRHYTVADGLASNQINAIMQDSLGYLWFATQEGLSRFDGYTFVNYGTEDGLPHPFVHDIVEDRFGHLWVVGGKGGVARFVENPLDRAGGRSFVAQSIGASPESNVADMIQVDRQGRLWSATDDGVYRGIPDAAGRVTFERVVARGRQGEASKWFQDSRGRVWLLIDRDFLVFSNGVLTRYDSLPGAVAQGNVSLAEDARGRILAAGARELYELIEPRLAGEPGHWKPLPLVLAPRQLVRWLMFDRTGRLWIATSEGILWWQDGKQSTPTIAGLPTGDIALFFSDRGGGVWIGTARMGLYRMSAAPVVSYGASEGLKDLDVRRVAADPAGHVVISTHDGALSEVRSGRVAAVPGSGESLLSLNANSLVCDKQGNFWMATSTGEIWFLPVGALDVRRSVPVQIDTQDYRGGSPNVSVDAAGDVWVSGMVGGLFRGHVDARGRPILVSTPLSGGGFESDRIGRVVVDRQGAVWLSTFGQLGRLRHGRVQTVRAAGTTETLGRALLVDSRGWLWVGLRYDGLLVSKDPTADVPAFDRLTTATGLSSNTVLALTEDRRGRVHIGTARAVDRFDPATGEWLHLTTADGLAGAPVHSLLTDRRGRVWIATSMGVTMYDPESVGIEAPPPPILLIRLRIDGRDHPVPARGAQTLPPLRLPNGTGSVLFEFVSNGFDGERGPRYQYRLEGADPDWSPLTFQRSVAYARPAPGSYRFVVRAVHEDGQVSASPATVELSIPVAVWRRPWFVGLALMASLGLGAAVHRVHLRQVLAMERIRRQVALDLHDDIGSGLSQIAIMSDAGQEESGEAAGRQWRDVGTLARGLRESMSDIVWAVDPRHDSLADLVRRMRHVSHHLLEAGGVAVTFKAPAEAEVARLTLAPDRRRHVLLIFKEAVHNVAKHADARTVGIAVRLAPGRLELTVEDNGRGFDLGQARDGNGLDSLRRRASELTADLHIESKPGAGTSVRLSVPL